jgi:two-component system, LuxR family, sensor kinase FixL
MKANRIHSLWDFVPPWVFGSVGLALLTVIGLRFQLNLATVALLYLIVVVVVSLRGSLPASVLVAVIAIVGLNYFFINSPFSMALSAPLDVAALIAFSTTAFVITYLVSRLRKSLEDLQASQDRVRLIVDTIPALVWSALPDGSRDFLSRGWLEYTGLASAEGLGWGWTASVHLDDRARFVDEWRAAVAAGTPFRMEARVRRADGEYRWLLTRAVPLRDASGGIVRWYGTSTDIEDQKRTEEAWRAQAEILDLTHDTVFIRDRNDVITYWNRGAENLYGWTKEEALGTVTHDLMQTIFPAPLDEIMATLTREGRWEGELVHTRRDGTRVVVASRWSLQRDDQGQPAGILETNNDVTGRKQAEESLRQAQAELAHVARVTTLGELAASIAHEINQPLAAIVADANACLHWLAADPPPLDNVREALGAVVKDSERAAEVLARIRALLSRSAVAQQPCDLNGVVGEVLPLVSPELARHRIVLHPALTPGLPLIMADRIQLQQVLLNLLLNAVEAVRAVPPERRRIVIRSTVEQRDQDAWVLLAVEDTGVGFREADADRLFEPFHTTKPGGLGMGLSISRSIVDRHGGQLWATPNADHGVTFHVALPGGQ